MLHELVIDVHQCYRQKTRTDIEGVSARYAKGLEIALGLSPIESESANSTPVWLDIGSNRGLGLPPLESYQGKVIAIDIEEKYLSEGLRNNPFVGGCVMDGTQLAFPDQRFDVVSCFEVIEHMEHSEQRKLLAETYRILKPEGIFVLSTPNKIANARRSSNPDHKQELSQEDLTRLVNEAGFITHDVLGQRFFDKGKIQHTIFRRLRQSELLAYAYYKILP